jgi:hypothetical protein
MIVSSLGLFNLEQAKGKLALFNSSSSRHVLESIWFQTLVFLSFTSFVYSSLQRAFWQGFSNTASACVPRQLAVFLALSLGDRRGVGGALQAA